MALPWPVKGKAAFQTVARGLQRPFSEPRGSAEEWLQGGALEMALKNQQDLDIWKGQDSRHRAPEPTWGGWAESIQWRWAGEASWSHFVGS